MRKYRLLNQRHATAFTLIALVVAGAFARLYGLGAWDYWYDEIWHVYVAGQPTPADIFLADLRLDGHPILPYLVWHYLLVLGNSPWLTRLPSLIAGIACIPAGYLLGGEMFRSRGGAFFCAFFMAFSGLMIEQSDVVRGYMPMLLFTVLGLWAAFRYRRSPQPGYLLLYGIFMVLALLCEYVAAPVIVFTALHLLRSICKQAGRRRTAFIVWAGLHAGFLAYLLWFTYLLRHVGHLDFSRSMAFIYEHAWTPRETILHYVDYFLTVINDNSFVAWISGASENKTFIVLSFLIFIGIAITGLVRLVKSRNRELLALVAILIITTLGFFFSDSMPLQFSRRNIDLSIAVLVLFDGGFSWAAQRIKEKYGFHLSPEAWALIAAAGLSIGYAVEGNAWRALRPFEFRRTHATAKEFFDFVAAHALKGDIIIADNTSYFYFWDYERGHCSGDAQPLSARVSYYPCYRIPLFVIRNDMRTDSLIISLSDFQQALWDLRRLHRLQGVKRVWIIGPQNSIMANLLNPNFSIELSTLLCAGEERRYQAEIRQLVKQQASFARVAFKAAILNKVAYSYDCSKRAGPARNSSDDCMLNTQLMVLPEHLLERVINHAPFADPVRFLDEVRAARRNRTF